MYSIPFNKQNSKNETAETPIDFDSNRFPLSLPKFLKFLILNDLDAKSLCSMFQICKAMHEFSKSEELWKYLFQQRFGETKNNLSQTFKELFIETTKHCKWLNEREFHTFKTKEEWEKKSLIHISAAPRSRIPFSENDKEPNTWQTFFERNEQETEKRCFTFICTQPVKDRILMEILVLKNTAERGHLIIGAIAEPDYHKTIPKNEKSSYTGVTGELNFGTYIGYDNSGVGIFSSFPGLYYECPYFTTGFETKTFKAGNVIGFEIDVKERYFKLFWNGVQNGKTMNWSDISNFWKADKQIHPAITFHTSHTINTLVRIKVLN